ncbi:hypothetical protein [Leuconostoc pseudomesenteroides]|uniref:hypothetical protein n=1 Tax=Leuconostoc pseudomesenteroides TaxID=33968 RepID=UPI00166A65C6|nr:hypothetical protein [Leuconostoc pseudomesenteroides]
MYSEQYAKLFSKKLDYNWEKEASGYVIRKYAKLFYFFRMSSLLMVLGMIFTFLNHPSPLVAITLYLTGLAMYFVIFQGAGYTSNASEFAHNKYQKFVVETIQKTLANMSQDKGNQYLDLLLDENASAIQKREKQYNNYFVTFLGIIIPFAVFAYNFMSINTNARYFVSKLVRTDDFVVSSLTLFVLFIFSVAVFGSKNSEYYLLLSNSTPYWKHKVIQKAILDEKFGNLCE